MKTIEQQIAEHEAEIEKLLAEQARLDALSPAHRLAEALHQTQCTWNHTDGCGWYYEVSDTYPGGTWNGHAHARYLKKANAVIALLPDFTTDQIIQVANALKG